MQHSKFAPEPTNCFVAAAKFRRFLALDFCKHFEASIWGSWQVGEPHIPLPTDNVVSTLSDVDILVSTDLTLSENERMTQAAIAAARSYGLNLLKVSIRNSANVDRLWSVATGVDLTTNQVGRWLAFWQLIGAIEADAFCRLYGATFANRCYAASKWFFKFCRNILRLKGQEPITYRTLSRVIDRYTGSVIATRAFAVKTGYRKTFSHNDIVALFDSYLFDMLAGELIDCYSRELIGYIAEQLKSWVLTGMPMPVAEFLSEAQELVVNDGTNLAVLKASKEVTSAYP